MTDNKPKRKRKTRAEMIADLQAKLAKYEAQEAGTYEGDADAPLLKQLKARLRKTNTELRAAQVTINGIKGDEGKGWTRSPIDEKIASTEKRLAQQKDTRDIANVTMAKLPFDVKRLESMIAAIEAGEGDELEFPTDLHPLASERNAEKSDEEAEANFIANEEANAK